MTALVLLHLILISCMGYWLYRSDGGMSRHVLVGLPLKIVSGLLLGLLYKHNYGHGDTWVFHQYALEVHGMGMADWLAYVLTGHTPNVELAALQPRVGFFIRILSPFYLISGGNYWVVSAYVSLLTFWSLWFFIRQCHLIFGHRLLFAITFLYFPSVLFWTSGIVKETVAYACIVVIAAVCLQWVHGKPKWYHYIGLLVSLYVLYRLKYYYAGVFGMFALLYSFLHWLRLTLREIKKWHLTLVFFLLLGMLTLGVSFIQPNLRLHRILEVMVENYHAFAALSAPDHMVLFTDLTPDWLSVLGHSPKALFSGLFRPLPWEAVNSLQVIYSLENLLIFVATIASLCFLPKPMSRQSLINILILLGLTVLLVTFLTLSAPNYGTLSRYRSVVLPFYLALIVYRIRVPESWLKGRFTSLH